MFYLKSMSYICVNLLDCCLTRQDLTMNHNEQKFRWQYCRVGFSPPIFTISNLNDVYVVFKRWAEALPTHLPNSKQTVKIKEKCANETLRTV